MTERTYVFTRFERLWHWSQAAIICMLLLSGFAIHGSLGGLIDFSTAHRMHMVLLWLWLGSYIFLLFWLLVTGEIKQYKPTTENVTNLFSYYSSGIFKKEPHPHQVRRDKKLNALQIISYDMVLFILAPIQIISGLCYLYYNQFGISHANLGIIAAIHTLGAFSFLAFLVIHIYLATTGPKPSSYFKAMFTGYNEEH